MKHVQLHYSFGIILCVLVWLCITQSARSNIYKSSCSTSVVLCSMSMVMFFLDPMLEKINTLLRQWYRGHSKSDRKTVLLSPPSPCVPELELSLGLRALLWGALVVEFFGTFEIVCSVIELLISYCSAYAFNTTCFLQSAVGTFRKKCAVHVDVRSCSSCTQWTIGYQIICEVEFPLNRGLLLYIQRYAENFSSLSMTMQISCFARNVVSLVVSRAWAAWAWVDWHWKWN